MTDKIIYEEKVDACPKCLDNMKIIVGEELNTIRQSNRLVKRFKCPICNHVWTCGFAD